MIDFFPAVHMVFTGIVLQALPFMFLGALLSSALHVFVPETFIIKLFPKKYGLGFLTALFAGLLFPICECASVPLMRGFIKKGVTMPIAVTFMLASPIINPVSIISTLYAFPQQPSVALYRLYFGLLIALSIGVILSFYPKEAYLREDFGMEQNYDTDYRALSFRTEFQTVFKLATGRKGIAKQTGNADKRFAQSVHKVYILLMHAASEFFTAGSFLIIGAFITALIRSVVSQEFFNMTSGTAASSLLLMMLFAFIFSACSTSDAFIARSFLNRFSFGSILGFLVYGPMMDIKNLCMLLSLFKKRFVIELTLIITVMNFIGVTVLVQLL